MSICLNLKTTLVCFSSGSKYDVSLFLPLYVIEVPLWDNNNTLFFTSTAIQMFCVICPDSIADISQIPWLTAVALSQALLWLLSYATESLR